MKTKTFSSTVKIRNPEINGKRDERGPWCFREINFEQEIGGIIDEFKSARKLPKLWVSVTYLV